MPAKYRMKAPSPDNTYALLALFLSPWKDDETVGALAEVMYQAKVDWGSLLHMANLHRCTPLWFVRLRDDGLLSLLPSDLQAYLKHLHQANVERNEVLREATIEILSELEALRIPTILLKGAATFCDDLYGDSGARMMADVDLLVKPEDSGSVRKRLLQRGYEELPDCFGGSIGYFNAYAPHHLPPFVKPGTSVVVEVHFQTARGQAGRVLDTGRSWQHSQAETCGDVATSVLIPSCRLLHNTVHALVPFRQCVRSTVSLCELAEFAHLVRRYGPAIDWIEWAESGTRQGLGRQFRGYLNLATGLMAVPFPEEIPKIRLSRAHIARISVAANYRACLYGHQNRPDSAIERVKWLAIATWVLLYSRVAMLAWVWHNLCYKKGIRTVPVRLVTLFAFFITGGHLQRFANIRGLHRKLVAGLYLLRKPGHLRQ